MKKLKIDFIFPLAALILLIIALSEKMFTVPPLGKILNPFIGAVQNERDYGLNGSLLNIEQAAIHDSTYVYFDKRKVPHIYAGNTEDLYFAQGYVTASMRLWQMEFLTYVAAGRLSELFGEGSLDYDRNQRRIGLLAAARKALPFILRDPQTASALHAYANGVNAYIRQLGYKTFPLEYKLLDYAPEPWTELKTVILMKYMANTLSGYEEDYSMSNIILALGEERFNKLYPDFNSHITPVVNDGKPIENNALSFIKKPTYLDYSFLSSGSLIAKSTYNPKLGSNSWAVSGSKTKTGYPILCNDPHLNLSLPAVWIEMQLTAPGINVYGVSIPGTPSVIIGFNENIAWGITNGADDVKDWYKLKITDDYKKYRLDGKWIDLDYAIEEIKIKNRKPFYDTIYHSVHGPVVADNRFFKMKPELKNYALKWELHNPSNEFLTFIKLSSAKNYEDYKNAIRSYACPVQNFTFACKDNTIAINHQGNMARKQPGQGKFLLDGTASALLSKNYITQDSLPQELNPACHYVLSANQHPTANDYPFYYNGYYSETRANRIKQILEKKEQLDYPQMAAMQLDNVNAFAVEAVPVLLKYLKREQLGNDQKAMTGKIAEWKGAYDRNDAWAKLFELWWKNIETGTWDELKKYTFIARMPEDYILLDLIRDEPANDYFDNESTSIKENASDIVTEAFRQAVTEYNDAKRRGSVLWGDNNKVNIAHMARIDAFSKMGLPSAGYPEAINAVRSTWGPSWRMIVELGPRPKAFGIYAGGQSGNIGSRYYDNFVNDWNTGTYYPLNYFLNRQEAQQGQTGEWIIKRKMIK
jgi:penicillin G amidase